MHYRREPMLHPDLAEIIAEAHSLGFATGMTTNGTLINSQSAGKLVKAGLGTAAISIDGLPDAHDHFRNASGSWAAAVKGAACLKKYGLEAQATTVVYKDNIDELEDIYNMLKELGFTSWAVINVDPIGRAGAQSSMQCFIFRILKQRKIC